VLRIFGPKMEEVTGGWRRLHSDELYNSYPSLIVTMMIKSRRIRGVGHAERMPGVRTAYSILVGKREGKRPFRRPECKWGDNIRMDLREIMWEGVDWMHLAQDRY
jgi:hypothetical protein